MIAFVCYSLTSKNNRVDIMSKFATTKLSSKGQVVIPEEIRDQIGLHTGDQFLVIAERDAVILKIISVPNKNEYADLIKKARKAARTAGLSKIDVQDAIKESRRK